MFGLPNSATTPASSRMRSLANRLSLADPSPNSMLESNVTLMNSSSCSIVQSITYSFHHHKDPRHFFLQTSDAGSVAGLRSAASRKVTLSESFPPGGTHSRPAD